MWRAEHGNPNAGRPSKLSPEVTVKLIEAFQLGMTKGLACSASGISTDAFDAWMKNNDQFRVKITRSQTFPERRAREAIVRSIDKGNTADAKWWLEHKCPEEFGSVRRLIGARESSAPVEADVIYRPEKLPMYYWLSTDDRKKVARQHSESLLQ